MEIIALRLVHVLGGIFWVGATVFTTAFLFPVLAGAGQAAGPVMAGLQQRRLLVALPVAALLTILSGLRLLWIASAGFTPAYFRTGPGLVFALSGVAAIVGFLVGILVSRPAALRAAQLARGGTADPLELAPLRRRAAVAGAVVTFLVTAAAAGMAVARYV